MPGVGNPESTPFLAYGPTARPDSWLLAGVPHTICQVYVPSSGPAWTFPPYLSTYALYAYMLPSRSIRTSTTSNYKIENNAPLVLTYLLYVLSAACICIIS